MGGEEKRRYKRIYFTGEDNLQGVLAIPSLNIQNHTVAIMDLSVGGIGFTLKRDEVGSIEHGQQIILRSFGGNAALQLESDITMEVRWILTHDILKHQGVGCEFIIIESHIREKIQEIVSFGSVALLQR